MVPAMNGEAPDQQADFGYRTVPKGEKAGLVRGVFDRVATRYDLMNDLMSAGVHRLWKAAMLDWLDPRPPMRLLDVAGGTGDIAFRFLARTGGSARGAEVAVADVNENMLLTGRDRAIDRGILTGIDWIVADAERLPLANASVDAYTIAFGIRNVTDIDGALLEARRVLKPGGRFLCLEFSHVILPGLERLYAAYSFSILPRLGQLVTGDADAYRYLVESIRRFPDQAAFAGKIEAAGLGQVRFRNLSGGIAAMHSAWRI
jgi:demethylmenaquinone methyltransferase/2-methoxy-6-polyprenyl-1,4-benzoquinol methylase